MLKMKELFEKYTDEEIMKSYPISSLEGRKMRRRIHEFMRRISEIDENTDRRDIDTLYRTAKILLPKEFTGELDTYFSDGHEKDVELTDMYERIIVTLTSRLFRIYYKYNDMS